jgi:cardiolipin synthase
MVLITALLQGCATLPNVSEILKDFPADNQPPEIVSATGPLSPSDSESILEKIRSFSGEEDIVERQTGTLEAVSSKPLMSGNRVTLLVDASATYQAMLESIRKAKHNINFETFIFESDEVGRIFAEEFLKKQAEGVQVNIIYDSIGSLDTPAEFFRNLSRKGVNVIEFNPFRPLSVFSAWQLTHRDHRKVLVVDGEVAFTGGVNISHVYSSGSSEDYFGHEREESEKRENEIPWRDTDVRIEGPVVAEFQRLFLDTWQKEKGPALPLSEYFPYLLPKGNDLVEVVGSTPGTLNRVTFIMYVAAFLNARKSIHLTTAYFVPDEQTVTALMDAAERGVDVKIILPKRSDSNLALYAGHYYYSDLLRAGVKLYERQNTMLHAKTSVVDGVWATVGSTNMDTWSFLHNNEINAVVISSSFADEMESLFENDLTQSLQVDPDKWRERSAFQRLREVLAHLLRRYL